MMGELLESHYKDRLYRSQLEARWAVFFDALGVPYEYQKADFALEGSGIILISGCPPNTAG